MADFTHFNDQGRAKMVDVGGKPISQRVAVAAGRVLVNEHTFALIQSGGMKNVIDSIHGIPQTCYVPYVPNVIFVFIILVMMPHIILFFVIT